MSCADILRKEHLQVFDGLTQAINIPTLLQQYMTKFIINYIFFNNII